MIFCSYFKGNFALEENMVTIHGLPETVKQGIIQRQENTPVDISEIIDLDILKGSEIIEIINQGEIMTFHVGGDWAREMDFEESFPEVLV